MKRKITAIALTLCMILSLLPAGVLARGETTSGTCGANLTWTEVDGVLAISGTGPMEDYVDATAPWSDSITEVRLESGVTTIGNYAFWSCSDLKKVTIPEGVTSIGDSAFYYCKGLGSVEFPKSVTVIGASAFAFCDKLTGIALPEGVTTIEIAAFLGCSGLENVMIPQSVNKIGDKAFGYVMGQVKEGFTITGYSGTAAETYAKKNGIPFTSLGSVSFFTDVPVGEYYYNAVNWAVSKSITNGTSDTTFSPNATCTRAQAVTFLWRAAGSPEPANANNPFEDVAEGEYYHKAVLWAVEKGITNGTDTTHFSPGATCNRAQIVTFLYRFEGQPETGGIANFNDVPSGEYYYAPVNWAVSKGVTNGTSAMTFSPGDFCTRGQIVTFLYRDIVGA